MSQSKWLPVLVVVTLASAAAARRAVAYSGPEHVELTNLGLQMAHETLCPAASPATPSCVAAARLLPAAGKDAKDHLSLGDFTRAGDFFTGTPKIVPDPAGCRDRDPETCPKKAFAACSELADGCFEQIDAWSRQNISGRKRWHQAPLRVAATHRNKNHFRALATKQYNQLHGRAAALARSGRFDLAFATEGVALHFLQDLFSPGHLASARANFADAAAGSIHDRFNRRGIPFRVAAPPLWCEAFGTDLDRCPFQAVPAGSYLARGDGGVGELEPLDVNGRSHRSFLVLASALSISQVMRAAADADLLQLCFQPQSARLDKSERPDWNEVWAPGAVLTQQKRMPLDPAGGTCQPELAGVLAGYATTDYEPLKRIDPPVSVWEVGWSPLHWGEANGGEASSRWELGWTFSGMIPDSELVKRGDADLLTDKTFLLDGQTKNNPLTMTLALFSERHPSFEVWGAGLLGHWNGNLGSKHQLDYYIAVEPGYALYRADVRDAWRWRASGRVGIGYGILFFEVGAERGFAIDPTGDGHREWRYFAGPRVRLASSWLARPFR